MDDKKIREDKPAAEEILKDAELDSVAGGGRAGGTGVGMVNIFKSQTVPLEPTDGVFIFGQLGPG